MKSISAIRRNYHLSKDLVKDIATETEKSQLNAIPQTFLPRFDPIYVDYYKKHNVGKLTSHQVSIEHVRKDPAKFSVPFLQCKGPQIYRVLEQNCPVAGGEISVRIFDP